VGSDDDIEMVIMLLWQRPVIDVACLHLFISLCVILPKTVAVVIIDGSSAGMIPLPAHFRSSF